MPEQHLYITQPLDDEIVISLIEQQNIVHDTVRIGIQVQAEHDPNEQGEDALRANIRALLKQFVNSGDGWRFTGVNRQRGQTPRFEVVTVTAITRVPESENRMLFERASAVSKQGLQLLNPTATYALPFDRVQRINRDLRTALVKQAQEECKLYNQNKDGNQYRVALVEFADTPRMSGDAQQTRAGRAYAANATSIPYSPSGGGADEAADEGAPDLGVTERFWVAAQVTLRANRG